MVVASNRAWNASAATPSPASINLVDGTGGTVNSVKRKGYSVVPGYGQDGFERSVDLLGMVPVVSAVMGSVAGGPAGRALLAHWTIMVRGTSQIFAACAN